MNRLLALTAFLIATGVASQSQASYQFCPYWGYTYRDQNLGEDYLKHNVSSTRGRIRAARSLVFLMKNGATVWQGALDSNGCTPAQSSTQTATWKIVLAPSIGKAVNDGSAFFRVYDKNNGSPMRMFTWEQTLAANSAASVVAPTLGAGDHVASVAAAVTHLLNLPDVVLKPTDTPIYADDDCGSVGSCGNASGISLGADANGQKDAFTKTVVLHEIGHALQDALFGTFFADHSDYDLVSSDTAACRCEHVQPVGFRLHCLQSQEILSAAIEEGWAQFIALDVLNRPDQADANFAYYKQFLHPIYGVFQPPVLIPANGPYKWNRNQCLGAFNTTGTELDWMTFFWELNNKGGNSSYDYLGIRLLFTQLCNGRCTKNIDPTMATLANAVSAIHGASSAKATFFTQTVNKHLGP